ncbi:glycoside hydrolase family 13 protein [Chryseolinea sp. H1M3-3]|uniref:glycoside hydrolase family 13 protein n=1 Tax=Chryseolinea sp. H1M3-3 TaxID=3034144 RepID=UPI0023EB760C|nr:glycoside hydrolase family 13 protein [Chryseolinea sp. H1M3-3]
MVSKQYNATQTLQHLPQQRSNTFSDMKMVRHLLLFVLLSTSALAQKTQDSFHKVEPPFWWIGMKNTTLQILFYNKDVNVSQYTASIAYDGVQLKDVKKVSNSHYLFLTLEIAPSAKAGNVPIQFSNGKKKITYQYTLKNKSTADNRIKGFDASDVIYLIMPDRFANGDVKNDSLPGMLEGAQRSKPEGRHGGDLKGISDHLEYIKDLGVTAIWLNPVLENNQPYSSYHGYAITDLYQVDRRFGSNEDYISFINKSHQLGLKVIQDMVMNHIGSYHWLAKDLPEKNWIHQFPEFTRSNYQGTVVSDPYQSAYDANLISNGWFDTTMPDVNQTDPLFATYLIQNTLWWIEHSGIDGIRMDTYPYPDKNFMASWVKDVMYEYPSFNIVGEVWIDNIATTAYWQKGSKNSDGYESTLPAVTDFPLCFSIPKALNEPGSWDTGMRRLYNVLSQDFAYPNANGNLIFLDNHDMTRIYLSLQRDMRKMKMALAFLLTTRGIPQLYYGTELLMDGDGGYHPNVRKDFPGGWNGDPANAFSASGRTPEQNEIYDYLKNLLHWRKSEPTVYAGKLTHYIPEDNIYVYFRHYEDKAIMVVLNANDMKKELVTERFHEHMKPFVSAVDILTQKRLESLNSITCPSWGILILELQK